MYCQVSWVGCLVLALTPTLLVAQNTQPPGSSAQPPTTNPNQADPNQAIFGHINQTAWFMEPNIRAQMQINTEQANRLNQAYAQFWNVYNRNQPTITAGATITPEQQQAIINANNRFYLDFNRSANSILDPRQQARFNQLGFQYRGYDVFFDPLYIERLHLTQSQIQSLKKYEQDYDRQLRIAMRNREEYPRKFNELRQDMMGRITSVLTDDQRKIWKELYGDPYTFVVK